MLSTPVILTVIGSNRSGSADMQVDIRTISALKGRAASIITAVTAQDTVGVQAIYPIPPDIAHVQTESVIDGLQPAAVKIGMVYDAAIIRAIAECLQRFRSRFVVCDLAMVSTSERRLMTRDTIHTIQEEPFPLCSLTTPNLSEVSLLFAHTVTDVEDMKQAAHELADCCHCAILVKGGHLFRTTMRDVLHGENGFSLFRQQKIENYNLHGTGRALSSATATLATCNSGLEDAVHQAKVYIGRAILHGRDLRIRHGDGPLYHFFPEEERLLIFFRKIS